MILSGFRAYNFTWMSRHLVFGKLEYADRDQDTVARGHVMQAPDSRLSARLHGNEPRNQDTHTRTQIRRKLSKTRRVPQTRFLIFHVNAISPHRNVRLNEYLQGKFGHFPSSPDEIEIAVHLSAVVMTQMG